MPLRRARRDLSDARRSVRRTRTTRSIAFPRRFPPPTFHFRPSPASDRVPAETARLSAHPPRSSFRPSPQRRKRVKSIVPESERRRSTRERVEINYAERYGLDDDDDLAAARRRAPAKRTGAPAKLRAMADGDHDAPPLQRRRARLRLRARHDVPLVPPEDGRDARGVHRPELRPRTTPRRLLRHARLRNRAARTWPPRSPPDAGFVPSAARILRRGVRHVLQLRPVPQSRGSSPTHQIIGQARQAGFDNVHDYLVHRVVGATPTQLARAQRAFAVGTMAPRGFQTCEGSDREGEERYG